MTAVPTAFQVSPPPKFDFSKPKEWPKWIRHFERFRIASGLELQSDENQVNTLIYTMGDEAEDVITSLNLTKEEPSEYHTLKDKLEAHFIVRRNVIFERAKFNQRQQEAGETTDGFITSLYALGEHCGYGALHSEMIRDRLVVGIRDKRLLEQLQMDTVLTSQLRWFGHLTRMPPGRLLGEVFRACPTGRRPRGTPGHTGEIISLTWPGNALVFPWTSWRRWLGKWRSGLLCLGCCPIIPFRIDKVFLILTLTLTLTRPRIRWMDGVQGMPQARRALITQHNRKCSVL
ncbi:type I keratin, acidic [Sarotherodon galilaeus]